MNQVFACVWPLISFFLQRRQLLENTMQWSSYLLHNDGNVPYLVQKCWSLDKFSFSDTSWGIPVEVGAKIPISTEETTNWKNTDVVTCAATCCQKLAQQKFSVNLLVVYGTMKKYTKTRKKDTNKTSKSKLIVNPICKRKSQTKCKSKSTAKSTIVRELPFILRSKVRHFKRI